MSDDKKRINTNVDAAADKWLRETAKKHGHSVGTVISDLVRTQGDNLLAVYQEIARHRGIV